MAKQLNINKKIDSETIYDKNVKANYQNEYENFYAPMNKKKNIKIDEEKIKKENHKKKIILGILIIVIGLIVFLLIKIVFVNSDSNADVTLLIDKLELHEGESKYISYKIVNYQDTLKIVFKSDDESIAKVDENGNVLGVSKGNTRIKLQYESNNSTKEKICDIIVMEKDNPNNDMLPSLVVEYQYDDKWINTDAVLKIDAKSNSGGTVNTKYTINCQDNCSYYRVTNNEIVIKDGVNKVTIITSDTNGKEVSKDITVKIDKKEPVLTLVSNSTVVGDNKVEVCAICTDNESGCKIEDNSNKICKDYTISSSDQVLTVEDNAGNIGFSSKFDVVVNK